MGLRLTAAARQLGISHVALLKAFKAGRVQKLPDGTFDVDACKKALAENSHPGKQKSARAQQRTVTPASVQSTRATAPQGGSRLQDSGNPDGEGISREIPAPEGHPDSYNEALRVREWVRVDKDRLDLARRRAELVPVGEINAFVAGMIMRARDILLRIGPELRDRLAQSTDPIVCEELITAEVNRSLRELSEYQPKTDVA